MLGRFVVPDGAHDLQAESEIVRRSTPPFALGAQHLRTGVEHAESRRGTVPSVSHHGDGPQETVARAADLDGERLLDGEREVDGVANLIVLPFER
jgi:hypothetical protein